MLFKNNNHKICKTEYIPKLVEQNKQKSSVKIVKYLSSMYSFYCNVALRFKYLKLLR